MHRPHGLRLTSIADAVAAGNVVSRVNDSIATDKVRTAHERAAAPGLVGKIVLDLS